LDADQRPVGTRLTQVLQVGTNPNKNLERLVQAIAPLPVHLRIVGSLSEEQQVLLNTSGLSYSSVANLSEEDLVGEYSGSDVLTFLSTYEGFGLPIVEAQAVGLPVITSNVSSMPEVAGDGAVLVDPFSYEAIRDAVVRLLESPDLAEQLVTRGRQNVQRYLPGAIARMYADIYREMGPNL